MGIDGARRNWRVEILIFFVKVPLGLRSRYIPAQSINFLFHLGVLRTLPNAFEVGLNLALELEAIASRTTLERFLNNITPQLWL